MERSPYLVKKVFKTYLVATLLSSASISLGAVIDGIIVGNLLGPEALAAVNLAMPVLQLFNALYIVLNVGGSMLVSMAMGRNDMEKVNSLFSLSMILNAILSVILLILGSVFLEPVVGVLCSNPSLSGYVGEYVRIVMYSAPIYIFLPALAVYAKVDNAPKIASSALVVANLLNISFDIIFIKVFEMGVGGSSLATSCGYLVGIVIVALHFILKKGNIRFSAPVWDKRVMQLIITGLPFALASVLLMVRILTLNNIIIHYLGAAGMFVLSVCLNLTMISSMFIGGVSQTMQPVAGLLIGAEDYKGVRMAVNYSLKVLGGVLVILTALICIFPSTVCSLFGVDAAKAPEYADTAIRLYGLSLLWYSLNYLLIGVFQLTGRNRLSISVSVLDTVLVLPIIYGLCLVGAGKWIWSSFIVEQILVLAFVIIATSMARNKARRKGENLEALTLLNSADNSDNYINFSVPTTKEGLSGMLATADDFLSNRQISLGPVNSVRICCEELINNIIRHAYKNNRKLHYIDVRIAASEQSVTISIVDDGVTFDPIKYDKENGIGLLLVKKACSTLKYNRLMGQNHVLVRVDLLK